ncbi:MAG TPA: Hpt domain-containing protein [Candidatus Hydrogenedentes bacterium]|nr:Hpt domain-containing protein [Candidatus Hydrogenedentota bacterium]HPG66174.1 Hpt domain-containing protein [Candidatus Hydrogenedentota bacterium]
MGEEATVDLRLLQELAGGEPEVMKELITVFAADVRSLIEQLKKSARREAFREIGQVAHTIKGAAGSIGAVRLEAEAGCLERLARTGDSAAIITELDRIDLEFRGALECLGRVCT